MSTTFIPLSALDLAIVTQNSNAAGAIERTVRNAQHVETLGFKRFWLAEHHNMEHIASSATAVLIGHVAGKTNHIKVGSGGIMLPNHSPLVIAEQFGTLETMYPGRIELGLGRAPGTDQLTAMALRKKNYDGFNYDFQSEILQLQTYLSTENSASKVRAFPGEGLDIPFWILGSSTDSAFLAAAMGLPYAFAAHFAPGQLLNAIQIYKNNFKPSATLAKPYAIACVNVIAAETDAEADVLANSMRMMFTGLVTNTRRPLAPPVKDMNVYWNDVIRAEVNRMLAWTFIGNGTTIRRQIQQFLETVAVDELMIVSNIYEEDAKYRSFEILNEALKK